MKYNLFILSCYDYCALFIKEKFNVIFLIWDILNGNKLLYRKNTEVSFIYYLQIHGDNENGYCHRPGDRCSSCGAYF